MYYYDSSYTIFIVLLMIAMGFAMYAQNLVHSRYETYKKMNTKNGMTGEQAARKILDANGLYSIPIECVNGKLSDHYDPRRNVVRLSEEVYYGDSVAAVGIASHEVGHAIQYNTNYAPIHLRAAIIPITNIGANISPVLIMVGILISSLNVLAWLGLILYSFSTIFQLVTLPVEINASSRALQTIQQMNLLQTDEEYEGAKKVLTAAAMTYVAALATSLVYLFRMVMMVLSNTRRDD